MNFVRRFHALVHIPCILLLLAAPDRLCAQYQKYEGLTVTSVRFQPAEQPLEPDELRPRVAVETGKPLKIADVRATIERLFASGRYADLEADATADSGGVAVVFRTTNRWFIGNVAVSGKLSSPPSAAQLEGASRLDLGAPFSEAKLSAAVEGLKSLLASNGLFENEVHPVLDYDSDSAIQQVDIRFEISTGRRARLASPSFTGDLRLDSSKILNATHFRRWLSARWKPMTQTRISQGLEGVHSLYRGQGRLEAKVTLEAIHYDSATHTAVPTIRVEPGPRIQVNVVGAGISQKTLERYVPIFEERAVDHDLLVEGARNLRDYFQSEGYFEAQVQVKEQRVENDRASVDFLVNLGPRHRLAFIGVGGNSYFRTADLRERMMLRTAKFLEFPHGLYSESMLEDDETSIASLYQSNGFRDVKVTHRMADDYLGKKGDLAVFLQVEEGPQYFVQNLELEGVTKVNQSDLLGILSAAPGQPFSEFNVALDRDAVLARYFESGFPDATFEWSFTPASEPGRVNLRYAVHEGQGQVVRAILRSGAHTTRERLVDRSTALGRGAPLSPGAVTDAQRKLYDLGVFAKVDAAIQDPDGDTESKYVLYGMEEAGRYSLAAGLGAQLGRIAGCETCLDAPAGATGFSPRVSLDAARNNLWGVAHSLSLRARVSTLDQRALLNYSWPRLGWSQNLNLSFTGLYEESRDIRTFNSKRAEFSAQLSQKLSKTMTVFYRYTFRRVEVSDLKVSEYLVSQLSQPVRVGMPSLTLIHDRRDDPVDPHRGVYNTLDLGFADHIFGSQPDFARVLVRNATYHPLGKRLVFARSLEIGEIRPIQFSGPVLDAVPLAERFFGGGGSTDRGFPEYQAGPRDPGSGFPLGGTALFFNQLELRFPVFGQTISGVVFHDAGNVYSSLGSMSFRTRQKGLEDFDYMVHAVGLGVRYRTPVGPVRADFAYSINPPYFYGFKGTQQELLNAGVNPCAPGVANQCVTQNVSHFQFFVSIGQTF